jgi:hypothetical protein
LRDDVNTEISDTDGKDALEFRNIDTTGFKKTSQSIEAVNIMK